MQVTARESPKPLRCPYCHDDLDPVERTWECPECATVHHLECVRLNQGCTLAGCSGAITPQSLRGEDGGPSRRTIAFVLVALFLALAAYLYVMASMMPPKTPAQVATPSPSKEAPVADAAAPVRDAPPRNLAEGRPIAGPRSAPALVAGAFLQDRVVLVRGRALTTFDDAGRVVRTGTLPGEVIAAAFTPDGGTLVYATREESTARLFRVKIDNGREVGASTLIGSAPLPALGKTPRIVVSGNGNRAITVGLGETVDVWDLGEGRRLRSLDPFAKSGSAPSLLDVALSTNGTLALTAHADGVRVWDVLLEHEKPTLMETLRSGIFRPRTTMVLAMANDRAPFASGCYLWEAPGGAAWLIQGVPSRAETFAVSANGRFALAIAPASGKPVLAIADEVHAAALIDLEKPGARRVGVPLAVGDFGAGRGFAAFDANASRVLVGADDAAMLDLATDRTDRTFVDAPGAVTALLVTPDEGLFVGHNDGRIDSYSPTLVRQETLHPLGRHGQRVESMAGLGQARTIVSASADETIHVWRAQTGEVTESIGAHGPPRSVAVEPEARERILIGDATGRVWLHEPGNNSPGRLIGKEARAINAVVALGNGRAASLDDAGTATVWSLEGRPFRVVGENVRALAASRGEVVLGFDDGGIAVVDPVRGHARRSSLRPLPVIAAIAAHPDGRHAATVSADGTVLLWDLATFEIRSRVETRAVVTALAFGEHELYIGFASGEVRCVPVERPW